MVVNWDFSRAVPEGPPLHTWRRRHAGRQWPPWLRLGASPAGNRRLAGRGSSRRGPADAAATLMASPVVTRRPWPHDLPPRGLRPRRRPRAAARPAGHHASTKEGHRRAEGRRPACQAPRRSLCTACRPLAAFASFGMSRTRLPRAGRFSPTPCLRAPPVEAARQHASFVATRRCRRPAMRPG